MISCLKDRIKEISETEKKIADETLKIIEKILDYNKMLQNIFSLHQKLVKKKKNQNQRLKKYAERIKSKNNKNAEIKKEEKNINNELVKYYFSKYQNPRDMYKKIRKTKGKENEDQVYSIKEILDKIKNKIKNVSENKVSMIEGNEKMIDIVEKILERLIEKNN